MGHAHVQTTMTYVHYVPQHDAAERLTRVFAASALEQSAEAYRLASGGGGPPP